MIQRLQKALLPVVILAFAVSLGYGFKNALSIDATLQSRISENALWAGAQMQFELGRTREALHDGLALERRKAAGDISHRFDILWSRAQLFRSGDLGNLVETNGLAPVANTIQSRLEEMDKTVSSDAFQASPSDRQIEALIEDTKYLDRFAQELTAGLMHAEQIRLVAYIEKRQSAIRDVAISLFGLLVFGLITVVGLVISNRRARVATEAATSSKLEAQAARQQMLDAIESMSSGFAVMDPRGNYVTANSVFHSLASRISGSPTTDEPFANALRLGFESNRVLQPTDQSLEELIGALERGTGDEFELALEDESWLSLSAQRTEIGNTNLIISDVTERKRWEIETEKAKETAVRNLQLQSRFLAMTSHEIRTPLNGVLGLLQAIADEPLSGTASKFVGTALKSAKSLRTIIDDVLDASKIEANELVLREAPLSIRGVAEEVLDLLTPTAAESGLEMSLSVDPDIPDRVLGDQDRLRQILTNFSSNAIKFTDTGMVRIVVDKMASATDAPMIRLAVEDTGMGIPANKQNDLFQPFRQIDANYSRRFGGTGLGLSISKVLAEKMGGSVGFKSREGIGSTFWCDIPLRAVADENQDMQATGQTAECNVTALPRKTDLPENAVRDPIQSSASVRPIPERNERSASVGPAPSLPGNRARILIAEDNQTNQLVVEVFLKDLDCECTFADDGQAAVERAAEECFDLILMDVSMPVMDGIDATKKIREFSATPIVGITAHAFASALDSCTLAGMDAVLTKPLVKTDLLRTVREFLQEGPAQERRLEA